MMRRSGLSRCFAGAWSAYRIGCSAYQGRHGEKVVRGQRASRVTKPPADSARREEHQESFRENRHVSQEPGHKELDNTGHIEGLAVALERSNNAVLNPRVRLGLVGCGRLAERGYLPAFRQAVGVDLVAVADANQARCMEIAPTLPAYESMRALVKAGGIDAVVIATPTRSHVADARLAAEVGLLSLVEKPPGGIVPKPRPLPLSIHHHGWASIDASTQRYYDCVSVCHRRWSST